MSNRARWLLTLLLAVSVGVNVYLVTEFLAGDQPAAASSVERALERRAARMPDADAALLRQALGENRAEIAQRTRAVRQARAEARSAMEVDKVDPAALMAALVRVRETNAALQESLHRVYVDVADRMSRDGRTILLDRGRRAARADRDR